MTTPTTFHAPAVRAAAPTPVRTREGHLVLGDLLVDRDADPAELRREALAEKDDDVAARLRTIADTLERDRQPAPRRAPALVQLDDDGAVLVDARVYGRDAEKARLRATYDVEDPTQITTPHDVAVARRVLDFLNSADLIAEHATRVGAPVTEATPPPARPRVRLRTEVEVDGLPAVDLAVYVHPSADTAAAVIAATRALHDAALAAAHVLVVEPADPAGGASA